MLDICKCEYGRASYLQFELNIENRKFADLEVDPNINFMSTNRGPTCDIALDETESRYLITANIDGSIFIYDTERVAVEGNLVFFPQIALIDSVSYAGPPSRTLSPVNCIQWSPVDSGLFITSSLDKNLKIWDTNTLKCVDVIPMSEPISWAAMSRRALEHNLIALALHQCVERQAVLVDPLVGAPTLSLRGGHNQPYISFILWSLRNSFLLTTAGEDGRILYWDIRLPSRPIFSLANSPLPKNTAYSREVVAHNGPVLGLTHTPDGLHLLSWGGTGAKCTATLRMWALDATGNACLAPSMLDNDTGLQAERESGIAFASCQPRTVNFGVHRNITDLERTIPRVSPPHNSIHRFRARNQMTLQGPIRGMNRIPLFSSTRMAIAPGHPSAAWGASAAFVFVPLGQELLVTLATHEDASLSKVIQRHHAKMTACVWNNKRKELYTSGMDKNLNVWPLFPKLSHM